MVNVSIQATRYMYKHVCIKLYVIFWCGLSIPRRLIRMRWGYIWGIYDQRVNNDEHDYGDDVNDSLKTNEMHKICKMQSKTH